MEFQNQQPLNNTPQNNMAITKLLMSKVYAGEYKEVHTRTMELDASFGAVNHLAYALEQKGNNRLTVEDLSYSTDIITYSDRPSAAPIDVNGGWGNNRYAFMLEVTIYETQTSVSRIYISGYTDRDDIFSLSGKINPEAYMIFNDVLVTKTVVDLTTAREVTRITTAAEILPTPEAMVTNRDVTLTPSDVYRAQQSRMYMDESNDNIYGEPRAVMTDLRIKNNGGKISKKQNASLDNHLVSVANEFMKEKAKDQFRTDEDVIADLTWSSREPDIRSVVALFRILEQYDIKATNTVRIGDLLEICPMYFASPQSDYIVLDKPFGAPDIQVQKLAMEDRSFNPLTTADSISTAATNVETKLAFMLLQEVMAIMSIYKVTTVAVSMTNLSTDRSGRPIVAIPRFDSFVRSAELSTNLYEQFRDALYGIFNKISSRNTLSLEAHVFIGFNTEKAEISVDGGHKVVLSLPRFMSSHFSNVVGSRHDLNVLADGYNSLFKEIGSVVNPVNTSGVNIPQQPRYQY